MRNKLYIIAVCGIAAGVIFCTLGLAAEGLAAMLAGCASGLTGAVFGVKKNVK